MMDLSKKIIPFFDYYYSRYVCYSRCLAACRSVVAQSFTMEHRDAYGVSLRVSGKPP